MRPLYSPPPYPLPQAGDGRVGDVGPGEECPAAPGQNAMAGLPDTVTETKPPPPPPYRPPPAGDGREGAGGCAQCPAILLMAFMAQTMKEVETNV